MTLYSVYEPPSEAPDPEARAEGLEFVKEGFSWPALLVPALWLIYYRMWIELILFVVLFARSLGVRLERPRASPVRLARRVRSSCCSPSRPTISAARRSSGRATGEAGTAIGSSVDAAELSFFQSWLPRQEKGRERQAPPERPGSSDNRRRGRAARQKGSSGSSRRREPCTSPSSITAQAISTPPPRRSSGRRAKSGSPLAVKVTAGPEDVCRGRAHRASRRRRLCRLQAGARTTFPA